MRTWTLIAAITLSLLIPAHALAAICFQLAPYDDIIVLEIQGEPAGGFYNLLGEAVGSCGEGTSFLVSGAAHLREDGKAHFGITVSSAAVNCVPFTVQGTLDPPSFNSGDGYVGQWTSANTAVTFTAVTCPAIPQ